jgi:hypothetical protein
MKLVGVVLGWRRAVWFGVGVGLLTTLQVALAGSGGWQLESPAHVSPPVTFQASAGVPGTNVVWLAGSAYPTAPVVFERRVAGRWRAMNAPATPAPLVVMGMDATSPNDVWSVGHFEPSTRPQRPAALHWDGSRWRLVRVPAPVAADGWLNAIAMRSQQDGWAVGGSSNRPLIEHWNGRRWSVVASPTVDHAGLVGVAVVPGSSTVWAVGTRAAKPAGSQATLIERWNGHRWRVIPSPNYPVAGQGPLSNLKSLAVVGPDDVWALGTGQTTLAVRVLVEHWNGARWAIVPDQPPQTYGNDITHVPDTRILWVVGSRSSGAETNETFTERITPSGHQVIPSPSPDQGCEHSNVFTSVAATQNGIVWASGFHTHLTTGCGELITKPLLARHVSVNHTR